MAQAKKSQRRGSRVSTVSSKRGMEFTKKIVILTALLFIVSLLDIRGAVREGLDVSGYEMCIRDRYRRRSIQIRRVQGAA